jgi:hypothetical protein
VQALVSAENVPQKAHSFSLVREAFFVDILAKQSVVAILNLILSYKENPAAASMGYWAQGRLLLPGEKRRYLSE